MLKQKHSREQSNLQHYAICAHRQRFLASVAFSRKNRSFATQQRKRCIAVKLQLLIIDSVAQSATLATLVLH